MVEIARNYHIEYQPDPTMFMVSTYVAVDIQPFVLLLYVG